MISKEEIEVDLSKLETITEKLNYWYDNVIPLINDEQGFCHSEKIRQLFGKEIKILKIINFNGVPETIWEKHFSKDFLNDDWNYFYAKIHAKDLSVAIINEFEKKISKAIRYNLDDPFKMLEKWYERQQAIYNTSAEETSFAMGSKHSKRLCFIEYLQPYYLEKINEIKNLPKYAGLKMRTPNKLPSAIPEQKKSTPKTLLEVWQGTREQYNKVIEGLKIEYCRPNPMPFIEETGSGVTWGKYPKKGFVQYLKGFLYECIQNGLIKKNEYSANQFKMIIKNTFNIDVNPEPFKDMQNPPLADYSKPFKFIPKNRSSQNS